MIIPFYTLTIELSNPFQVSADDLRSFFLKKLEEYTPFHKDSTDTFIYRYPVVQCKQVKGILMVIGIGQGAGLLQEISRGGNRILTGENSCRITGQDKEIREETFSISDKSTRMNS